MAKHLAEVGQEARAIFAEVRQSHIGVLERFHEGFLKGCSDVAKGWKQLKAKERSLVFNKVRLVALDVMVDVLEGGSATNGLKRSTFNQYVCKVKKALKFGVSMQIAERATHDELEDAQKYFESNLQKLPGTHLEKMEQAYKHVKDEQAKARQNQAAKLKANNSVNKNATLDSPFVLPDPDTWLVDLHANDHTGLLTNGIQVFADWLQTKSLQASLQKDIPAAKVCKNLLGECLAFLPDQESEKEKAA